MEVKSNLNKATGEQIMGKTIKSLCLWECVEPQDSLLGVWLKVNTALLGV